MIQWYDPTTGSLELWVTNGTVAGTLMLHDFFEVGTSSIDFVGLAKNGAALLLINEVAIDETELYASDGTVAGTKLLNDFIFSTVTPVTDLATGANVPGLFSSFNTFTSETQLWGTDGTPAGTSMLLSSSGVDNSVYFTEDAGTLFAMAILSSNNDSELWSITP
jgi:ELWxxDGT repeat protein